MQSQPSRAQRLADIVDVQRALFKRLTSIGVIDPPHYDGLTLPQGQRSMLSMLIASGGVSSRDTIYKGMYVLRDDDAPTLNAVSKGMSHVAAAIASIGCSMDSPQQGLYRISKASVDELKARQTPVADPDSAYTFFKPIGKLDTPALASRLEERQFQLSELNVVCASRIDLYDGVRLGNAQTKLLGLIMGARADAPCSSQTIKSELYGMRVSDKELPRSDDIIKVFLSQMKAAFRDGGHPIEIKNVRGQGHYLTDESKAKVASIRRSYGIDAHASRPATPLPSTGGYFAPPKATLQPLYA